MSENETAPLPGVTNKYAQEFVVPQGFADILRDLTREILRTQPKDIDKFGNYSHSSFFFLLLTLLD